MMNASDVHHATTTDIIPMSNVIRSNRLRSMHHHSSMITNNEIGGIISNEHINHSYHILESNGREGDYHQHYQGQHHYHHHITTPEEEAEARAVGFTLGLLVIAQYILYIWKKRAYQSYQMVPQ